MEGSKSMTAQTKGRIRHVALSVKDPWETAEFYKQAVGLQEVMELDGPLAEGVFLTDGVVNLAILHFKSDEASQGTGVDYVGIHHIGFWVDDVVEQGKIARNVGATWIMGDPDNPNGYEVKHTDLNGIIFDIAAHGWAGSQKDPGSEDNVANGNPQRRLAKFDARRAQAKAKFAAMRGKKYPAAAE
jgi:catechol 2,3-dioxygenase-like lactoylglutathione lyase family enzyme